MDGCHILLGRPWQFDRGMHHDGWKNTYTFVFSKVKIVLTPNRDDAPKVVAEKSSNLLSMHRFVGEMVETGVVYILLGKEQRENSKVPEVVKGILEEAQDHRRAH